MTIVFLIPNFPMRSPSPLFSQYGVYECLHEKLLLSRCHCDTFIVVFIYMLQSWLLQGCCSVSLSWPRCPASPQLHRTSPMQWTTVSLLTCTSGSSTFLDHNQFPDKCNLRTFYIVFTCLALARPSQNLILAKFTRCFAPNDMLEECFKK